MTTSIAKTFCAKCDKGAGIAMCCGCKQIFCTKHFIEHRQKLLQQIDDIGLEHDGLRKDSTNEQAIHALLDCINQWEQDSITKVQAAAKSARADLQQLLNRAKTNLNTSFNQMAEELQSSRDSDDYTELNIKKWSKQLQEFRKLLDSPPNVKIDYNNDTQSVIRLLKVTDQLSSNSFHQASQLRQHNNLTSYNLGTTIGDKFDDVFGSITLSESELVATCLNKSENWCCVSGIGRYSSGTHCIRFRIEHRGNFYAFFGIVNASETMTEDIQTSTSCYGWWNLGYFIVSGKEQRCKVGGGIKVGDEVTLILDCDKRRIQLQHHGTNTTVDITVDLQLCAFPWKMIVLLRSKDDCVRIIHKNANDNFS